MTSSNPYETSNSEPTTAPHSESRRNWVNYSSSFNSAMWTGLKIQAVLAVLTALMLDFGQIHREFWLAMLCQWATVFMILLRRPMAPLKTDLAIVRYGIIPFQVVVTVFGHALLKFFDIPHG